MSGLVGYGSSSDEDEYAQQLLVARNAERPSIVAVTEADNVLPLTAPSNQAVDGPMVGPAVPTNNDYSPATADEKDGGEPEAQMLSERETIRVLTQPSHPMSSIPPSPPGSPNLAANAKFRRFLDLKAKGIHFNEDLASKSSFRNPKLLSTMMARAGVDESEQYNTSLPKELWDPVGFPPSAYKEELGKSQQLFRERDEARKKELSASGTRTIEFNTAERAGSRSRDSTPASVGRRRKP